MEVTIKGPVKVEVDAKELDDAVKDFLWEDIFGEHGKEVTRIYNSLIKKYGSRWIVCMLQEFLKESVKRNHAKITIEYIEDGWGSWNGDGEPNIKECETIEPKKTMFVDENFYVFYSKHFSIELEAK